MTYIKSNDFNDFKENQNKLINILNHNMTILTTDVKWVKKIQWGVLGTLSAILLTLITKIIVGL